MSRLLVCNVAGLSPHLLQEPGQLAATRRSLGDPAVTPLRPVFPAVTCTAQATFTTGRSPAEHGIVANGLYDPQRRTVAFWEQAAGLIPVPRLWDAARECRPGARTASLFWWNGMHSTADVFVNVAPFHFADGRMLSACYTRPSNLDARLALKLGPFPLHRYWGPMTSIEGSAWIAEATKMVIDEEDTDLVLTYLPHLDYGLQKFGPDSDAVAADLDELDGVLSGLVAFAQERDYEVLILSEYGVTEVSAAVDLNRELRKMDWIAVREAEGREYLDIGASPAFAMVDHQVAHLYTHGLPPAEVAAFVAGLDGVERVLTGDALREAGLAHPRTGDAVAIAEPDRWFSYYWWLEPDRAPDFAGTIDIHRKPGFDPLEMFFDPETKKVSQDTSLIRGSHGRVPEESDHRAVLLADFDLPPGPNRAEDLFDLVLNRLCR